MATLVTIIIPVVIAQLAMVPVVLVKGFVMEVIKEIQPAARRGGFLLAMFRWYNVRDRPVII